MKPEESPVRMPLSEITATMECLAAEGVTTECFKLLRSGHRSTARAKILAEQLAIHEKTFSHVQEWTDMDARWQAVEKLLVDTAKQIHHAEHPEDAFRALRVIVAHCCEYFEYEFIVWQAVCEAMFQISHSFRSKQPSAVENIRRLISSMEHDPNFRIGCHHFDGFLPPGNRDRLHVRTILPLSEQSGVGIEPLWPRDLMARLQMILTRFLYWSR